MMVLNANNLSSILNKIGIEKLNNLQTDTLAAVEEHHEIVIAAPTGSGKTIAFLLPVINALNPDSKGIQSLILSPTRELALQISEVFRSTGVPFKLNVFYGGHNFKTELQNLSEPPAVVVATPGRLADHLRRETLNLSNLNTLVIDEFDKCLELGFENEMQEILNKADKTALKILTSATPISKLPDYLKMKQPSLVFSENIESDKLETFIVDIFNTDKLEAARLLLSKLGIEPTLLFCNHREAAERINNHLMSAGFQCDVFHGGLRQEEREKSLIKFRNGSCSILVTTDLASRGLDIPEVKHVIHYQMAENESAYIHRNGRTARMSANGAVYILKEENEHLPEYVSTKTIKFILPKSAIRGVNTSWETLYFGAGKKEKINKIDLVGSLTQMADVPKDSIGRIDVLDHYSFVAIKRGLGKEVVKKLNGQKIKKKQFKIALSR
jgi:ATP-independent RNA helicase DbpA